MYNSTINPIPKRNRSGTNWRQRASKFNNENVRLAGYTFDSKAEALHFLVLQDMVKQGEIRSFRYHVPYKLFGKNGTEVGSHETDFEVLNLDGSLEIQEVKGYTTDTWKLKKKLFEDNYPDLRYVVIPAANYYGRK